MERIIKIPRAGNLPLGEKERGKMTQTGVEPWLSHPQNSEKRLGNIAIFEKDERDGCFVAYVVRVLAVLF